MHLQPRYDMVYFHKMLNMFFIQKLTVNVHYFLLCVLFIRYVLLYNVFIPVLKNTSWYAGIIQEEKSAEKLGSVWNDS